METETALKMCMHKCAVIFYVEDERGCPTCGLERQVETLIETGQGLEEEIRELRRDLAQIRCERATAIRDRDKMFAEKKYWHDQAARLGQELHEIKCAQKESAE